MHAGFTKKESSSSSSATSPSLEIEAQEYMAIDSYEAQGPGQINFEEGEIITVLDKLEDGKTLLRMMLFLQNY